MTHIVLWLECFATFRDAGLEMDLVEFSQGQSIRWLPIYLMVMNLGPDKSSGMLFFPVFISLNVCQLSGLKAIKLHGRHVRFALK